MDSVESEILKSDYVVGIDPGSQAAGYAVLRISDTGFDLVASGTVKVSGDEAFKRIYRIASKISECVLRGVGVDPCEETGRSRPYGDVHVFYESQYCGAFAKSALTVATSAGAIGMLLYREFCNYRPIAPKSAKLCIAGNGAATKVAVRNAVLKTFGLRADKPHDECDAIAIAYAGYKLIVGER